MDIKKIVVAHYKNDFNLDITQNELNEFVKEYMLIKELKEKYNKGEENRKELGNEILLRTSVLKDLLNIFERSMQDGEFGYKYPNSISDYSKVLDLLVKLSNKDDEEKYIIKKYCAEQIGSQDERIGYKESKNTRGNIWVVGNNIALSKISNKKTIKGNEFKKVSSEIINDHNSLVMITDHYYESRLLPTESDVISDLRIFDVDNFISGLCCYTFNDELGEAVSKLGKYIDYYGGNIDNIPVDILLSRINELNNNDVKKLEKKYNN